MLNSVFKTQNPFYINEKQELQEHKQETKGDSQHMGDQEKEQGTFLNHIKNEKSTNETYWIPYSNGPKRAKQGKYQPTKPIGSQIQMV